MAFLALSVQPGERWCTPYAGVESASPAWRGSVFMPLPVAFSMMLVMLVMFVRAVVMRAMRRAVAWRVFIGVPRILDKIDVLAAGVIRAAVLRPLFGVTRRDAQIDGRLWDVPARLFDDDWLGVDHRRRWEVADVEATVEARLADLDRDAHVGRHR